MTARTDDDPSSGSCTNVPFDPLQAACQRFSGECEAGGRPDLPSYLVQVAGDDQATLLRNLLEYEVRKRRKHGESPRAEEYLGQLPNHTAIIRQVFLETSSMSLAGDRLSTTWITPRARLPASRLGEFRLVRELGRGGMGAVYEAIRTTENHRVALKTLGDATIVQLARLIEADMNGRSPLPGGLPDSVHRMMNIACDLRVENNRPEPIILGRHLIALGHQPDVWFGEVLKACFAAQLDGDFETEPAGIVYLEQLVAEMKAC